MSNSRVLTVHTRAIQPGDPLHDRPLLELLPRGAGSDEMSWVRHGDGLVAWGVAARVETAGPGRFDDADVQWRQWCEQVHIDDEVGLPGTGPVAFASLAFDDAPGHSSLIVPEVVVGQRDGVRWLTTVGETERSKDLAAPVSDPGMVRYSDGLLPATAYREAVAEAVSRMRAGEISKIVLAHDLLATTSNPLDIRFLLANLAGHYPSCWTFAVDGLVGATPEMLLERHGDRVHSRVLAGTSWPRGGVGTDRLAAELLESSKNRGEHTYAVDSLVDSLRPFCSDLAVTEAPEVLHLPNVMHLTSDVSGRLDDQLVQGGKASLLHMVDAVHPTAAVGGTPTRDAVALISKLEGMDRERYAGPVGWLDSANNGEFGLALRCAQLTNTSSQRRLAERKGNPHPATVVRLFAGCGVVADSNPDDEVAEAEAKLSAVRQALEGAH